MLPLIQRLLLLNKILNDKSDFRQNEGPYVDFRK